MTTDKQHRVIAVLGQRPAMTTAEVCQALRSWHHEVYPALRQLERSGQVVGFRAPASRSVLWALTDTPE